VLLVLSRFNETPLKPLRSCRANILMDIISAL
jgi:hypothetical protein